MPPARRSSAGRSSAGRRPGAPRPSQKSAPKSPATSPPKSAESAPKEPASKGGAAGAEATRDTPAGTPARADAPARPVAPGTALGPAAAAAGLERAVVIAGTAVGIALGVATAVWELFLSPVRWGAVPLPLAPLLAVVTMLGLIWFTRTVTHSTGLALLPGVAWFAVMVWAALPHRNGSAPMDVMGLITVLVGSATWTIAAYRVIARRPPL